MTAPAVAYDIYYSVRNFEGGPEALAVACRPLLGDPVVEWGLRCIAGKFGSREDFGPETVRRFRPYEWDRVDGPLRPRGRDDWRR